MACLGLCALVSGMFEVPSRRSVVPVAAEDNRKFLLVNSFESCEDLSGISLIPCFGSSADLVDNVALRVSDVDL
jgi:hypothetical protein